MIRFDAVTKRFPDGTVAVDELTLKAPTGEITVLVGPSGCGKTTSLRMVNRMIEPDRGHDLARRPGHRADERGRAAPRHRLRHPARGALPAPHRPRQRRHRAAAARLGQDSRPATARSELLERVGLAPELGDRYPAQLSGGQQQRVGVARALAADPPVMLMDEPFCAVDPVVREQLQDEFLRLQAELGKTIVFVTHDIDEAIKLGDQVAVLRVGGRLAQVAEPAVPARPPGRRLRRRLRRPRPRLPRPVVPGRAAPAAAPEPTVLLGERPSARMPSGCSSSTPTGARWAGSSHAASVTAPSTEPTCTAAAPWRASTGSLRGALDAALSSPSGRGVVVDDDGRAVGTVAADEVLAAIEDPSARARRVRPVHGGAACGGPVESAVTSLADDWRPC